MTGLKRCPCCLFFFPFHIPLFLQMEIFNAVISLIKDWLKCLKLKARGNAIIFFFKLKGLLVSSNCLEKRRLKAVDISASAIGTEKLQRNLNYTAWVHSQALALTILVCLGKLLSFWASDFPLGKWEQPWYYTGLHDGDIRSLAWCLAYEIKNISCFYYFFF